MTQFYQRAVQCLIQILTTVLIMTTAPISGKKNVLVFLADDAGFLASAYNNTICDTPALDFLASRSVIFQKGYTSVSSCSPSRSVLLTGLPQHQNGMYGLHHSFHHFNSFDGVKSLPHILSTNGIRTGLIGKKHVGPADVYKFDYERSNDQYSIDQIGRNLTFMKNFVREFLQAKDERPFFLYIAPFDTHRAGNQYTKYGPFMDHWGTGKPGMGLIPDWKPHFYKPEEVEVPYFLPDTPETRTDLAAMYTSFNRLDQGIGLFLNELKEAGHMDDTLILFTSDNGIPFPNAKTNLYESGMGEPALISSPLHREQWSKFSDAVVSTMDFAPTILDWFNIPYPQYKLNGIPVTLTGRSLLPLTAQPSSLNYSSVFSSHDFHEVTMSYPMRVMRTEQYRLIHNINYGLPYPLATDLFSSRSFMDILNRTLTGQPTHWFKTLKDYYYRQEWELFDLSIDPKEIANQAYNSKYEDILTRMKEELHSWLWATNDPWVCMPHGIRMPGVWQKCYPMHNEL